MTNKFAWRWGNEWLAKSATAAALLVAGLTMPTMAFADELPLTISPLTVVPDRNGVNLATGKISPPTPTLSIPAAPRLKFDLVQNAAPYIKGVQVRNFDEFVNWGDWTVHTIEGSSEAFRCVWDIDDKACESVAKSGSYLSYSGNTYRKAGSGETYSLNLTHVFTAPAPSNPDQRLIRQFYASKVDYPDGEVLSYTYGTATLANDPYARPFYRPIKISTNLGYYIEIAYQGNDLTLPEWSKPSQVTIYKEGDASQTPLVRMTYNSNGSATDLAGRVFQGITGGSLGMDVELASFTQTLPTEATPSLVANPTVLPGGIQMVASINRDGVPWNYSYANPQYAIITGNYQYDSVTVTGPNGYRSIYEVTKKGNQHTGIRNVVTARTDELNRKTSYEYDSTFRLTRTTAPEGNYVNVAYDNAGNIVSKTAVAKVGSGLPSIVEQLSYNVAPYVTGTGFMECTSVLCWRPSWHQDALSRQTDFLWNARGQLLERTDPADQSGVRRKTINEYQEIDSGGGQLISRVSVSRTCGVGTTCGVRDETRTEYQYTGITFLPTLERRIDPVTGVVRDTWFAYDPAGRVTYIDGPLPGQNDTQYTHYDVLGRKRWEIGALAPNGLRLTNLTTYRESDDKPIFVQRGTVADAMSPALTEHERVDMAYDSRRNLIRETRSSGGLTRIVTDRSFLDRGLADCTTTRMYLAALPATGNACTPGTVSPTDGADRITRNIYDIAGQLVQVREGVATVPSIEAAEATYSYTSNGKRQFVIDANGNRAQLVYDGHDRQTQWIFPSSTRAAAFNDANQSTALATAGAVNAADYEQYTIDANGNRTLLRKRDGRLIGYGYDALNRMISKGSSYMADIAYSYDLEGRQLTAKFATGGEGITNIYNGFGELKSSTITMSGLSAVIGMNYDAAGKRTSLIHPDGQTFTYARDSLGRATDIYEGTSQTPAARLIQSTFDNRGLPDWMKRSGSGPGFLADFSFDDMRRLSSTFNDAGGAATANDLTISQDYNPASQIWRQTRTNDAYSWTGSVAVNRNYTTNGLNQYTVAGPTSLTYDANGNLTSDGSATFTYDVENRLVGATGANTASLVYDPMGRLFQTSGGAAGITRFVYDGDELVAEYDAAGTMTRRYVHSDNVDDPAVQYDGAGVGDLARSFLMPDERGSIVALIRNDGAARKINTYDEYGIPGGGGMINTNEGRFQYTGQAWLPELGMYHYKARIYSPKLGRFLQVDPIGYDDQVNLYAYVGNDPVNKADPNGTTCVSTATSDKPVYSCRIDKVATVDKNGKVTGTRAPTARENKRFASFNKRYTDAVNRLAQNPGRSAIVAPMKGGAGSFETTAGKAASALIEREFIYTDYDRPGTLLGTAGGPGVDGRDARTFVHRQDGLETSRIGIVHDGGLHGTREEFTGGLQRPGYPLNHLDHQQQYNSTACALLGERSCD